VIVIEPWTGRNPKYPAGHKISRVDAMLIPHGHFDHVPMRFRWRRNFRRRWWRFIETCHWLESQSVKNTCAMNKGGRRR
jgi:L-ascorbate metabolism protein UlaG (beta-lactamase superfamily)